MGVRGEAEGGGGSGGDKGGGNDSFGDLVRATIQSRVRQLAQSYATITPLLIKVEEEVTGGRNPHPFP